MPCSPTILASGLGKSRQLIEASEGTTLVVAPAGVINGGTWDDEIARWADNPSRFTIAAYTQLAKRDRGKTLPGLKPEYDQHWDTVIVDEAHYIKSRSSGWTARVQDLSARSDRVYLATGTPIPNWAHELFTMLQVIHPDQAKPGKRYGSYWRWVAQWFHVGPGRFSQYEIGGLLACNVDCADRPAWDPCEHYGQFCDANFDGRFMQRRRDDVLDLPEATEQWVQTPMDAATRKAYNQMKKEFLADLGDGDEVVAWTPGSRQVMLDKMTTSLSLLDPSASATVDRGGKLDQLREDLQNRPRPTLVVAHYRDTVDACARVAQSLGMTVGKVHGGVSKADAARDIQAFKDGRLQVLVGSLETIAEGLTLVAADMCVFVERSYKPYRNVQAMRRIHRMGQTRPVTIRYYLTPKSIDSNRQKALESKIDQQNRVLSSRDFAALL